MLSEGMGARKGKKDIDEDVEEDGGGENDGREAGEEFREGGPGNVVKVEISIISVRDFVGGVFVYPKHNAEESGGEEGGNDDSGEEQDEGPVDIHISSAGMRRARLWSGSCGLAMRRLHPNDGGGWRDDIGGIKRGINVLK